MEEEEEEEKKEEEEEEQEEEEVEGFNLLSIVSVPADSLEQWQWDAEAKLGRHVGQGVTGGLAGQGGAPGEAGVHLDDVILPQSEQTSRR